MSVPAHFEPVGDAAPERRGARRLRLCLGAELGACASSVVIHDLSLTGLQIETAVDLSAGTIIEVALPELGPTRATVMWREGPFFGCRFEHSIPQAAVSAALLRSVPVFAPGDAPPAAPGERDPGGAAAANEPGTASSGSSITIMAAATAALVIAILAYAALTGSLLAWIVVGSALFLLICAMVAVAVASDDLPYLKL